jgi:hypothetical protein
MASKRKKMTASAWVDKALSGKTDIVRRARVSLPKYLSLSTLISEMSGREITVLMNSTHVIFIRKGYISILN